MSSNRSRPLAIAFSSLAVLGLTIAGVTQAYAADREKVDTINCGSDCTDFEYIESSGREYHAAPVTVSAEGISCPGGAPTTPNATQGYAVTQEKSYSETQGADAALLSVLNATVSRTFGKSVATTVQSGQEFAAEVPEGQIGHFTFSARMYHSEGVMNWTEQFFDEFHSTADFTADVSSETPMVLANKLADGRWKLESRPMTEGELATHCG